MKAFPEGFDESELFRSLADGWGLKARAAQYAPVGFGSYHWIVDEPDGDRHFVTVDDLNHKSWLGDTPDSVFDGLRRAFDTALALRLQGGLGFVLAPLPTIEGETVRRIGRWHTMALFPFIEGRSGQFGDEPSSADRAEVLDMLVELHGASPTLCAIPHRGIVLPGRDVLESALMQLDRRWRGGPFAEPARDWLASHGSDLRRLLDHFDKLAGAVTAANRGPVITHGETHSGNFIRSGDGLVLVDWDTVGLAPPERDLWHVATADGDELARYSDATGRPVDEATLSLYRLGWDLMDVAAYLHLFRSRHGRTEDTEKAWRHLTQSGWLEEGLTRPPGVG
jgi:spectinomycin phosphotransferase